MKSPYRDVIAEARIAALKNDVKYLGAAYANAMRRAKIAESMLRNERVERAEERLAWARESLTRGLRSAWPIVFAVFVGFVAGVAARGAP